MVSKDLTAFLTPNLELPYQGKTYVVPPPDFDTGLKLTAIHAYSVAQAQGKEAVEKLAPAQRELVEAVGSSTEVGELSLGPAYQQMRDDKVPGPHIDTFALYAMYYWVLGEAVADHIMEARRSGGAGPKAPQDRRPPKSGHSTASAKSSATTKRGSRSSNGTKASRAKSAPQKASTSDGGTSSTTGT